MSRQGRVSKEKNGTWSFVVDIAPRGAPRKQVRRRGFRTKGEAQEALTELLGVAKRGTFVDPSTITVAEWFDRWIESLDLAPNTVASYRDNLRLHATPDLGAGRLQALTTADIDRLYASLRAEGQLSLRTIRIVHTAVRQCLNAAVKKNLLTRNPTDAASPPSERSAKAPEMTVWAPSEMGAFLEHEAVRADRLAALWRLLCSAGLRRGEALGLRWSDLDGNRLSVRRQVIEVDGKPTITDTKTGAGHRAVALDDATLAELRAHRARQAEERLACGPDYRDDGLIFPAPDGKPLAPLFVTWRFNRLVRMTGAPKIRLHDLRHSHATNLLAAGVNAKVVSSRLGHSKVQFTMDKYQHVVGGMDEDAAVKAAALVDGAGTT